MEDGPTDLWYLRGGDGVVVGPWPTAHLVAALRSRGLSVFAQVWRVGAAEWTALATEPAFAAVVREVAPPPPPSAVALRRPEGASALASWAVVLAVLAVVMLLFLGVRSVASVDAPSSPSRVGVAGQTGGRCADLRDCCDEMETKLPRDPGNPHRREECLSWTEPGNDSMHVGTCAYGTECWCGRMLDVFRQKYAMCR